MTEMEKRQQQEIERLQKKLKLLTEAYNHTVTELNQIKKEGQTERKKGRPSISPQKRAQILSLCRRGNTMRAIADETGVAVSTVHKVIAKAEQESRMVYVYLDRGNPATWIDVYGVSQKVHIVNFTEDMLSRAFGIRENPNWEDFEEFLESRCMPRTRYGIREEVRFMGLDVYDPFQIVIKTKGRVYGDGQSLERMRKDWFGKCDEILKTEKDLGEQREELYRLLVENRGKWEVQDEKS